MNLGKTIDLIIGPKDRFSLEDRILNTVLLLSALARYLSLFAELAMGFTGTAFWCLLITNSFITLLYVLGRRRPCHQSLILPYIFLQLATISITWYYYDGISGTSNAHVLGLMFVIPIILKGKKRLLALLFFAIYTTSILILELIHPDIVFNYPNNQLEVLDTFFTSVSVAISIVAMLSLVLFSYDKKQEQIKELNKTKDKFFSIIAHDLKGPLAGLTQLGEYLWSYEHEIDERTRKEMEESIYKSSKNTYNLLENLLQWARSESGQLEASPARINILKITLNIETLIREKLINKNLILEIDIHEEMYIYADENMISLVIRNLLSNAVKFTPTNGKIRITANKDIDSDLVNISVHDNGIGIEENAIEKLFDLDSTYRKKGTNKEPGTGLGLKLCREFVLKNNGKIFVESTLNMGSTFMVFLPTG